MTFLLCGQTDSGKSTIAGNLLYQVGYFSDNVYKKYTDNIEVSDKKSKWSILMDLFDGEILSNKTKTEEFTLCPFTYKNREVVLIDTPGHQLYIRSLISGLYSTKIDLICIVLSSIPSEFIDGFGKGTTKEDLLLARSVGCSNLLIVWNKTDVIKPTIEQESSVQEYVKKLRFKKISTIYVSGYTGENVLNILDYLPETREVEEEKKESINSKKLTIKVCMHTSALVSAGYVCVLHHISGEYSLHISKLKGVTFVKGNDPVTAKIVLDKNLIGYKGDRIILRKDKDTIGYGYIVD